MKFHDGILLSAAALVLWGCSGSQNPAGEMSVSDYATENLYANPLRNHASQTGLRKVVGGKEYTINIVDESTYRIGVWDETSGSVAWGANMSGAFTNGSICINSHGIVIAVRSVSNLSMTEYAVGVLNTGTNAITWKTSGIMCYSAGAVSSVDLNEWDEFVAICSNQGNTCFYCAGWIGGDYVPHIITQDKRIDVGYTLSGLPKIALGGYNGQAILIAHKTDGSSDLKISTAKLNWESDYSYKWYYAYSFGKNTEYGDIDISDMGWEARFVIVANTGSGSHEQIDYRIGHLTRDFNQEGMIIYDTPITAITSANDKTCADYTYYIPHVGMNGDGTRFISEHAEYVRKCWWQNDAYAQFVNGYEWSGSAWVKKFSSKNSNRLFWSNDIAF